MLLRRLTVRAALAGLLVLCALASSASAAAQSAPLPSLTGEALYARLTLTWPQNPYVDSCFTGATTNFSFSGIATGPYPGTFTEQGTITDKLAAVIGTGHQSVGSVISVSATFSITSDAGSVTGTKTFNSTTGNGAQCTGGIGGESFWTDPLATAYAATITTAAGSQPESGAATTTFSAAESGVAGVSVATLIETFGSSTPPTSTVPAAQFGPPTVAGATVQGQTLDESHGSWLNGPTSYSYQWHRCDTAGNNCHPITDATGATYTLTAADVGSTIRAQEWAINASGTGGPAISAETAVVLPPPPAGTTPPPPSPTPPTSPSPTPPTTTGGAVSGAQATPGPAQIKARLLKQLTPAGDAAKIGTLLKKGSWTYSLRTLTAGRIVISWYYLPKGAKLSRARPKPLLIGTGKAVFSKAGPVKLTIKLTAEGKRMLKAARRLNLRAKGIYTPTGNAPVVTTKTITLKR